MKGRSYQRQDLLHWLLVRTGLKNPREASLGRSRCVTRRARVAAALLAPSAAVAAPRAPRRPPPPRAPRAAARPLCRRAPLPRAAAAYLQRNQ
eukprot:scaffold113904_cov69-Phaeocystis_antarctica.AAC.1